MAGGFMTNRYYLRMQDIVTRYGFDQQVISDSITIHNILMDIFKTRCQDKKTALWGAGRNNSENSHASVIIKKYTTYIQSLSYLIDSLPQLWGKEFMGYPIISPKDIEKAGIEIVIIASKVQGDSIKKGLKKYAPNCEYIDIYEELKSRGIVVYHKFYEESSVYTVIHSVRQELKNAKDTNKPDLLKKLISLYMGIKDISYALEYAAEYVWQQYENWKSMEQFITEVKELVSDIKKVNADKKDDVVIYFIDSLRAMDVFEKQGDGYQPKLLANYLDKSVVFTNARSTGVTTYESMVSVIRQIHPYDSNVYDNNIMFEFEEFELLNIANSLNYEIRFYTSEGYPIIKPTSLIHFTPQVYMTEKLWTLACDMAESNRKTLNFVYFPYELHFPLICGYHTEEPQVSGFVDVGVEDTSKFVERQLGECLSYVDRQMEYYRTFFSDDILMALFSDHSQVVYDSKEQKPYFMYYNNIQRSVGITFFIKGHGLQQQWNENLVSLIDFNTMMKSILCEGALNIPNNEIVQYQYYKIHYKKLREIAMEQGLTDYIDGMNCYTSKEYIYIVTKTGVEEVYCVNDTKSNIIATVEGQDFRDMVKQNYEISFPDFL
jgi:hypothetical protein